MKIENIEQIEAIVKLCRKLGVEAIEVDGVKLSLGEAKKRSRKPTSERETEQIESPDALTEEQLLMWSATPVTVNG